MSKAKAAKTLPKDPADLIARKTGDWWQDERRNCCAYCGRQMRRRKGPSPALTGATRDHVIPRAHNGGFVTVPSCRECNQAKGSLGLPEFLSSDYFAARSIRRPSQWTLRDLWLAVAMEAVMQARYHAAKWPQPELSASAGAVPHR
jgi:hypothetical protein